MLVVGVPATAFGENCYLVAPGPGEECVVIDPGIGVVEGLDEAVAAHRLRPVAVLLTHGHIDHTFSVVPVCGARNVPAYVHPADAPLLSDPAGGLSAELAAMLRAALPQLPPTEPDDVRALSDGAPIDLAGLKITVDHAPGHTAGSVMFRLPGAADGASTPTGLHEVGGLCFSGDTLFAGAIGRMDMPGGDEAAMTDSLRRKVLPLPDDTGVLPGHGPHTTIGRERRSNPYLAGLEPDGHTGG